VPAPTTTAVPPPLPPPTNPSGEAIAIEAEHAPGTDGVVGYWILYRNGFVTPTAAPSKGSAGLLAVDFAVAPSDAGYWIVDAIGRVRAVGVADHGGVTALLHQQESVTGIAARPDGTGYWIITSDGRLFSVTSGGATLAADLGGSYTDIEPHPGGGVWLVRADQVLRADAGAPLDLEAFPGRSVQVAPARAGGGGWSVTDAGRLAPFGTATGSTAVTVPETVQDATAIGTTDVVILQADGAVALRSL
jgi:hypothetical protein